MNMKSNVNIGTNFRKFQLEHTFFLSIIATIAFILVIVYLYQISLDTWHTGLLYDYRHKRRPRDRRRFVLRSHQRFWN